jgi:hypothetical protein
MIDDSLTSVEDGKINFVLPFGSGNQVTYADTKGLDSEYALKNIRIYWFGADDLFRMRFGWGEGTTAGGMDQPNPTPDPATSVTSSNNHTVVTIATGGYDGASKFYIVANVNGDGTSSDMVYASKLNSITSVTTATEFEAILSDALDNSGGSLKLLGTPLLMTIAKNGTSNTHGYIPIDDPSQGQTIDVKIKRRVARFDIVNSADYSNFEITNVVISRAQRQAFLQDSAFVESAGSWANDSVGNFLIEAKPLSYDSLAFNGPRVKNPLDVDNNGKDDAFETGSLNYDSCKYHLTKAAFYLYPTLLDKNGDDKRTQIAIEGIFNKTTKRVYKLEIDPVKYPNGYPVEANNIYRIHVREQYDNRLQFDLEVLDWDHVDTVYASGKGADIVSWGTLTSTANPSLNTKVDDANTAYLADDSYVAYEYSSSLANPDTLVFQTQGTNKSSTSGNQHTTELAFFPPDNQTAGIEYLESDLDRFDMSAVTVISETDATYAPGGLYTTTHKIVLPPTTAPIDVKLQITNPFNPQAYRTVIIRSNNYNGVGHKPVKFTYTDGGETHIILVAPVNVGATELDTTSSTIKTSTYGLHYQWGRNKGWNIENDVAAGDIYSGTLTNDTAYSNKFINPGGDKLDWLSPSNDDLWGAISKNPKKMQGPCPEGWRIPTYVEIGKFNEKASNKGNHRALTLDDGKRVILQAAGWINSAGVYAQRGDRGYYWSLSPATTAATSWYLRFARNDNGGTYGTVADWRVIGYPIRAVRDVKQTTPSPVKRR